MKLNYTKIIIKLIIILLIYFINKDPYYIKNNNISYKAKFHISYKLF